MPDALPPTAPPPPPADFAGRSVAVVGAGIVGAACAWELAAVGCRVAVLERAAAPATESTARSAAGLRHQFSHPVNTRMSAFSRRVFAAFDDVVGADAGLRSVGYLFLVPPSQRDPWVRLQARLRRDDVPVERLDLDALRTRFPWIDVEGVAFGSFGPADGVVDPHSVALGYLAAARRHGATVSTECAVVALERRPKGWRVRVSERGEPRAFEVDAVVNAAGPWAAQLGAMADLELPVEPTRRCVYATGPLPAFDHHPTPLTVDLASGVYLRSEGERLIFGASNPDEPPSFGLSVDWSWLESVLAAALPRFPVLHDAGLDRGSCWAGLYSITPDGMPIVGVPRDRDGFCNAVGFSGHGVQHAPATARMVREALVEGRVRSFDPSPFDLERFARSTPPSRDDVPPERAIV